MAYPTDADIDAAVPADGTPDRAATNALLKALTGSASQSIAGGSLVMRTDSNGPYTAGRIKAAPGMDPDDVVTLGQALIRNPVEPTSATAEGEVGDYHANSQYLYICISINQWIRIPVGAW